tara:strand:+ start:91 stop:327 length:237 start_codon:yes stop_codon:yes gene_type:complete
MRDYQVTVTTTVTRTYEVRTFSEESVRAIDWRLWDDVVEVEMKNKPSGDMHKEFNVKFVDETVDPVESMDVEVEEISK